MEIIIGLIALVVFAYGSYFRNTPPVKQGVGLNEVLKTPIPETLQKYTITLKPEADIIQKETDLVQPLPTSIATSVSSLGFIYPSSTVVENSGDRIRLTTSDTPDKVTTWYQDKIKSEGMNTTSFVKTSINGKVQNKLAGAGSGKQVSVEISKSSQGNTVIIVNF